MDDVNPLSMCDPGQRAGAGLDRGGLKIKMRFGGRIFRSHLRSEERRGGGDGRVFDRLETRVGRRHPGRGDGRSHRHERPRSRPSCGLSRRRWPDQSGCEVLIRRRRDAPMSSPLRTNPSRSMCRPAPALATVEPPAGVSPPFEALGELVRRGAVAGIPASHLRVAFAPSPARALRRPPMPAAPRAGDPTTWPRRVRVHGRTTMRTDSSPSSGGRPSGQDVRRAPWRAAPGGGGRGERGDERNRAPLSVAPPSTYTPFIPDPPRPLLRPFLR